MSFDISWAGTHDKYIGAYIDNEIANAPSTSISKQGAPNEPFLLDVTFNYYEDEMSGTQTLLRDLGRKITIIHPREYEDSLAMTLRLLPNSNLIGVLVTDSDVITKPKYTRLMSQLVTYVRNGGTLVYGGDISGMGPTIMNPHLENTWSLPWRIGEYGRNSFFLNATNEVAQRNASLDQSIDIKTMCISHIQPEEAVYKKTAESSHPPGEGCVEESPIVCTKVGRGMLGYVGDVNNDAGSRKVVLAMFGLLDTANV